MRVADLSNEKTRADVKLERPHLPSGRTQAVSAGFRRVAASGPRKLRLANSDHVGGPSDGGPPSQRALNSEAPGSLASLMRDDRNGSSGWLAADGRMLEQRATSGSHDKGTRRVPRAIAHDSDSEKRGRMHEIQTAYFNNKDILP